MGDAKQVWQITVEQPLYLLAGRKQEVRSIIAAVLNLLRLHANCTSSSSAESIRRFASSPQRADWLWISLSFRMNGYQTLFLWDWSLRVVKLTTYFCLMTRRRKSGAIPPSFHTHRDSIILFYFSLYLPSKLMRISMQPSPVPAVIDKKNSIMWNVIYHLFE
jgi:hypothetical protein